MFGFICHLIGLRESCIHNYESYTWLTDNNTCNLSIMSNRTFLQNKAESSGERKTNVLNSKQCSSVS